MSGDYLRRSFRRRVEDMEERLAEIRHRLIIEEACTKAATDGAINFPGFLETEEELLDEAAELERILVTGESQA